MSKVVIRRLEAVDFSNAANMEDGDYFMLGGNVYKGGSEMNLLEVIVEVQGATAAAPMPEPVKQPSLMAAGAGPGSQQTRAVVKRTGPEAQSDAQRAVERIYVGLVLAGEDTGIDSLKAAIQREQAGLPEETQIDGRVFGRVCKTFYESGKAAELAKAGEADKAEQAEAREEAGAAA